MNERWPIRSRELSFTVPMTDQGAELFAVPVPPEREVTIRLRPGESWAATFAESTRPGKPFDVTIHGERFVGRVKSRRRERLTLVGQFRP